MELPESQFSNWANLFTLLLPEKAKMHNWYNVAKIQFCLLCGSLLPNFSSHSAHTSHTPLFPHLSCQNTLFFLRGFWKWHLCYLGLLLPSKGYTDAQSWRKPLSTARLPIAKAQTIRATKRCFPLQGHHYQCHHAYCYGSTAGLPAPALARITNFHCKFDSLLSAPCEDYREACICVMFWIVWSENLTREWWTDTQTSTQKGWDLVVCAHSDGGHLLQQPPESSAHRLGGWYTAKLGCRFTVHRWTGKQG